MATRPSRNISLTAELDGFIDAELASGDYGNASEVVRTALKLLRERGEAGRPPVPRGGFPIGGGEC
ncbi:type II toxin-antitoxin system ParD family antitoxin, partial [Escherichia coli]|nr:type II toxin-antitoxin system ParD family antitoxin [Escherichia coli]